jgi:hypothetical protein
MKKESRTIISQNADAIQKSLQPYQVRAELLNRILDNMNQAGHQLASVEEVTSALTTGLESAVRNQLTEKSSLELGGIRISKSAFAGLVDLPNISSALEAEALLRRNHKLVSEAFGGGHLKYPETALDGLEFHKGRFEISEAVKEKVISQCTTYTTCAEQTRLLEAAQQLLKEINAFDKAFGATPFQRPFHPLSDVSNLFRYDPQAGEYILDTRVIINLYPPLSVERKSTETASVQIV